MSDLRIFAGPRALRRIRDAGLQASDVSWLAGASGGPKWFVLYGLDRYLAGNFFKSRQTPLRMIGSSAGAWRLACHAQADPVAAIDRLANFYSQQTYSARPDIHEISREARLMLDRVLGDQGAQEIASNTTHRLYVIADQARRWVRSDSRSRLNSGLAVAACANMISRRLLRHFFSRHVFHNQLDQPGLLALTDLPTCYQALTETNVREALMASGSIPLVMEAVTGVAGAVDQVFRDGGITDYHLDLPFNQVDGLVLYPHFYAGVIPGWLDKFAPWRTARPEHFDNVVLVAPSLAFVQGLPYSKIPDRNDFRHMADDKRLQYWQTVLANSERLAEAFAALVERGEGIEEIQPFRSWRRKHV